MIVVLDSSAAIEVVLKREKGNVFRKLIASSEKIITSEFFKIEVANVLRKYYKGQFINRAECIKLLELSHDLVDEFVLIDHDYAEALNEAIRLDYSAMICSTLSLRVITEPYY